MSIDLEIDAEPRVVEEPSDLAKALNKHHAARAAFDRLPFGLKRKHVAHIKEQRRRRPVSAGLPKLVDTMRNNDEGSGSHRQIGTETRR